jgi:hypothetical protein
MASLADLWQNNRSAILGAGAGVVILVGLVAFGEMLPGGAGLAIGKVLGGTETTHWVKTDDGGKAFAAAITSGGVAGDSAIKSLKDSSSGWLVQDGLRGVSRLAAPEQAKLLSLRVKVAAGSGAARCARMYWDEKLTPADLAALDSTLSVLGDAERVEYLSLTGKAFALARKGAKPAKDVDIPPTFGEFVAAHATPTQLDVIGAGQQESSTASAKCAAYQALHQAVLKAPASAPGRADAVKVLAALAG